MVKMYIYVDEADVATVLNEENADELEYIEANGGADICITYPEKLRGEAIRIAIGDSNGYSEYSVVLGLSVDAILQDGERPKLNGGDDLPNPDDEG